MSEKKETEKLQKNENMLNGSEGNCDKVKKVIVEWWMKLIICDSLSKLLFGIL